MTDRKPSSRRFVQDGYLNEPRSAVSLLTSITDDTEEAPPPVKIAEHRREGGKEGRREGGKNPSKPPSLPASNATSQDTASKAGIGNGSDHGIEPTRQPALPEGFNSIQLDALVRALAPVIMAGMQGGQGEGRPPNLDTSQPPSPPSTYEPAKDLPLPESPKGIFQGACSGVIDCTFLQGIVEALEDNRPVDGRGVKTSFEIDEETSRRLTLYLASKKKSATVRRLFVALLKAFLDAVGA